MEDFSKSTTVEGSASSISTTTNHSHERQFSSTQAVYRLPFSEPDVAIFTAILSSTAVFGMITNITTIVVIYRSPSLRSIFNLFIMSLCFSDLISATISPLQVYRRFWGFERWIIPFFLCKVYWAVDVTTSYATTMHILVFCLLRFHSLVKPHYFGRIRIIHAKISIALMWAISVGCGFVPFAIWFKVGVINRFIKGPNQDWPDCTLSLNWLSQYQAYSVYGYAIFYYTPLVSVTLVSIAIGVVLRKRRMKRKKDHFTRSRRHIRTEEAEMSRQKKENQAIIQLTLIVVSFFFGYIPISSYYIVGPNLPTKTFYQKRFHWCYGTIAYVCMRLSECFNPVFYNLGSSKLRGETKKFLRLFYRRCKCSSKKQNRKIAELWTTSIKQTTETQI